MGDNPLLDEIARNLRLLSDGAKVPAKSAFYIACCQQSKRLLKTFDRYHLEPARMLLRILGVPAHRNDEEIHIRTSRSDRLLLDSSDR